MKVEHIAISKIKANPKNPRKISDAQLESLARSLKDFPQMLELRPLILDKTGMVIGGNMRLAAAKKLGLKTVPTIRAEKLTAAQIKEFIVKDNVGFGVWDWQTLSEWDVLKLEEWGVSVPDFGDLDMSILDNVNVTTQIDKKSAGVMRGMVFEFNHKDYDRVTEYVKILRAKKIAIDKIILKSLNERIGKCKKINAETSTK